VVDGAFRSVFFDLDGTLVDSLPGIQFSIEQAFLSCGRTPRKLDVRPLLGPPIGSILDTLAGGTTPHQLDELVAAFRASYDSEGWHRTNCYASASEVLGTLHNLGLQLFVVTNKPQTATCRILNRLGIAGFFQEILSRDSRSPSFVSKAEMLSFLLDRFALEGACGLMVGDTMEDVIAAEQAGIRAALVTYGYGANTLDNGVNVFSRLDDLKELELVCARGLEHD
jgi:phosphoglycolate phosphatase